MTEKSHTILITGFGSFGEHKINASWEAVKLLPSLNIEEEFNVRLIIEEIAVAYEAVIKEVPRLWEKYRPLLVVHVGVSKFASDLTLESRACKLGYCKPDVDGNLPQNQICAGRHDVMNPSFDVQYISNEVNKTNIGVNTCVSSEAGRYLCEFIYYTSLNIDHTRTLFIHVPDLNKPYSAIQLAQAIKEVLQVMIDNIDQVPNPEETILHKA